MKRRTMKRRTMKRRTMKQKGGAAAVDQLEPGPQFKPGTAAYFLEKNRLRKENPSPKLVAYKERMNTKNATQTAKNKTEEARQYTAERLREAARASR
jgi:hypothetical protein